MNSPHVPVLLSEVLDSFKSIESGVIIDCTLGYGGHSQAILDANPKVKIIACDRDDAAISFCRSRFANYSERIDIRKNNFSDLISQIDTSEVRGILADIGVSSLQLDLNERGFSVKSDILDMRMDKTQNLDAKKIVNSYDEFELERIFREFGELPNARALAKKIITARKGKEINSARELAEILGDYKVKNRSINQVILAFQAIRIEVNNELGELKNLLENIANSRVNNAILDIISFHSLEDKIVKQTFKKWSESCICPPFIMKCECGNNHALGRILTKKPLSASKEEIKANSRSSCAKLRSFMIEREK